MLKLQNDYYELLYNKKVTKEYALTLNKIKKGEKISILSDAMFKTMFQTEERKKYSCKLISYFVDISYEELLNKIYLEKNELDKRKESEKGLRCDYVANIDETKINIEINNNSNEITMERNMEYAIRLYASKAKRGREYEYTQVVQFNINNFAFAEEDKLFDVYSLGNNNGIRLTDKIIIIQIYIPNIRKKWYTSGIESLSEAERYILGLVEPSVKASIDLGKDNEVMKEYINDAINASDDEMLLEAYDKEWALKDEGIREGVEKGISQGITQGKNITNREIVLKMLEKNLDINLISEITGLNIQQINDIKK